MSIFDDWMNALSKPPDDSSLTKELDRWKQINESLERGDYISAIGPKDSPITHMEQTLEAINEKLEIEHQARLDAEEREKKQTKQQERTDCIRFWITFAVTLIGSLAAVGGLIATIVLS